MPNWGEILSETQRTGSGHDVIRRKYLRLLAEKTKRNVIAYYSGWLQKPGLARESSVSIAINDADKNGFMAVVNLLDRKKGLDLLLHTPGGDTAATESLVDYLRAMFGTNIRAFVPQLALSAGTMIACACKEIWMGKQSSIGPIDPQMEGLPATGIKEEFERAAQEIKSDQDRALVWQPIIRQLRPSVLDQCNRVIDWSRDMVTKWLETGMFDGMDNRAELAKAVVDNLMSAELTKTHARHINAVKAREFGLIVRDLEDDHDLQNLVLTVHHACTITLEGTPAYKLIENQNGNAYIQMVQQIPIPR